MNPTSITSLVRLYNLHGIISLHRHTLNINTIMYYLCLIESNRYNETQSAPSPLSRCAAVRHARKLRSFSDLEIAIPSNLALIDGSSSVRLQRAWLSGLNSSALPVPLRRHGRSAGCAFPPQAEQGTAHAVPPGTSKRPNRNCLHGGWRGRSRSSP